MNGNKLKKISTLFLLTVFVGNGFAQNDSLPISSIQFRVQLVLPLFLDNETELKGADAQWQKIAVSYYQGVLTALDSLERAGFKLQLFIDDYKSDTNLIKEIMTRPDRQNMDLIIGPLYKNGFHVAERFAAKNKIPILSPFLTFQTQSTNEFSVAANPTIESYGREMARYINNHLDSVNILLVHDGSAMDKSFTKAFNKVYNTEKRNLLKDYTYARATHPAKGLMMTMYNWVIIPSKDEKTVNTVLYQLHDTIQDNPMSVVGVQPWLEFSNVNFKLWDTLDIHLLTPYYINYHDSIVHEFVMRFREHYATDPDEYVFRGYDQFLVMMYMLRNHGKTFQSAVVGKEYPALHTRFRFNREAKNSGLENGYLAILRYNEFRFHKLQ